MYQIMKKIPTTMGRLTYISEQMKVILSAVDADDMPLSEVNEITEPLIEMLAGCTEGLKDKRCVIYTDIGDKIVTKLKNRNKITAIKYFRDEFGTSLKESKNEIERIYDGNGGLLVDNWEYNGVILWRK